VDVVNHALALIEQDGGIDILVVQHANVGTITTKMIDDCIEYLIADESLSSVVPVHEKSEYHPFRAKTPGADGLLSPFFDFSKGGVSGNRQDLPVAYFFDHSIWVLSVARGIHASNGQPPWTCMGSRIKPYITEGCFDVHTMEDLKKTEEWLLANHIAPPSFLTPIASKS
jgi:CMP-N,N'-diacetyllegionaminic acid synthase